jgi:hypothetical protein
MLKTILKIIVSREEKDGLDCRLSQTEMQKIINKNKVSLTGVQGHL